MPVGCLLQKDLGKIMFRTMSVVLYVLGHHSNGTLSFINETKFSGFDQVQNYKSRHKEQAT
jgi:hypothetical protein